jgi:hypothetical protein
MEETKKETKNSLDKNEYRNLKLAESPIRKGVR